MTDSSLQALCPLDGRYNRTTHVLSAYFSEYALLRYRIEVEIAYVLFLSAHGIGPKLTKKQIRFLQNLAETFSVSDAQEVKRIEATIYHDVKAVEYFIASRCEGEKLSLRGWIHIGLTSEDTNALAYGLSLLRARSQVILPTLVTLTQTLVSMAEDYVLVPMLARTHGQPAVPTTVGKELIVFALRLASEVVHLSQLPIEGKLTGAVGNFNAHVAAFPKENWRKLSDTFVMSLGLTANHFTTQILPADSYARLFDSLSRINTILLGLSQDIWRYISDGYFVQRVTTHHVGSSTMPPKVNPIDFENAEGNLGVAIALLSHMARKLSVSRLQRDLSDSTVKRNTGVAVGYGMVAYQSLVRGLGTIQPDQERLQHELMEHWEIVTEGIQTLLRSHGQKHAYETLKALSRGKDVKEHDIHDWIDALSVSAPIKKQLHTITPVTYLGLAQELVEEGVQKAIKLLAQVEGNNL